MRPADLKTRAANRSFTVGLYAPVEKLCDGRILERRKKQDSYLVRLSVARPGDHD